MATSWFGGRLRREVSHTRLKLFSETQSACLRCRPAAQSLRHLCRRLGVSFLLYFKAKKKHFFMCMFEKRCAQRATLAFLLVAGVNGEGFTQSRPALVRRPADLHSFRLGRAELRAAAEPTEAALAWHSRVLKWGDTHASAAWYPCLLGLIGFMDPFTLCGFLVTPLLTLVCTRLAPHHARRALADRPRAARLSGGLCRRPAVGFCAMCCRVGRMPRGQLRLRGTDRSL